MRATMQPAAAGLSASALSEQSFAGLFRLALMAGAAAGLRMIHLAREWRQRAAGRSALARMDERGRRDLGLSRGDAEREARKPFWQA